MDSLARGHWPLVIALGFYWITVLALMWQSVRLNQGHLIYPLDDAYIHMAIAKNASAHGVWGMTRYEFTSSTSSPLWTALLAAVYWASGVGEMAPLVLNVIFGSLIILVAYGLMRRNGGGAIGTCVVLLAVVFLSALPALTLTGMEHTLHTLIMLLFMSSSATVMFWSRPVPLAHALRLTTLAALLTTVRYEGFFALIAVVVLLLATRHRRVAAGVGAGGLLPPAIYGLWAMHHGSYALPNSVLLEALKGRLPAVTVKGFGQLLLWWRGFNSMVENPYLLVLVAAALIVLIVLLAASASDERVFLIAIFIAVTLLHLEFATAGWFYRYEGYLVITGLIVLGATSSAWTAALRTWVGSRLPSSIYATAALLTLIVVSPIAVRAVHAMRQTVQATHNIFEQQYQMGLFVDRYYSGRVVAANDIGAITYFADIKLVDLYGLGSIDVARLMLTGNYTQAQIHSLATKSGVDLAIAYDDWFDIYGGLPSTWHKVGEWVVQEDNVVLGGNVVSFYAVRSAETPALVRNLKAFGSNLPSGVEQRGEFTN
jgi:hypothetical protein